MTPLRQLLKPNKSRPHLERGLLLLPPGGRLALWSPEGVIASAGEGGDVLSPMEPGVKQFPLRIDGEQIGALILHAANEGQGEHIGAVHVFLGQAFQSMIDAEVSRRSVTAETLESYREMALLQRAVHNFNQTLKPEKVARVLLKEIDGRASKMEFGAVYRRNSTTGEYQRLHSVGERSGILFDQLEATSFMSLLDAAPGILNDIAHHPRWPLEVAGVEALLILPLLSNDENLGALVLGSSLAEAFISSDLKRAETLASVAGTAIRNAQLFAAHKTMFHSFVDVMSSAIDAASPFTAGHCLRVPNIAQLIAQAVDESSEGPFRSVCFSEDEWEELHLAASLHDCGKVNTPSWLIDKSTKLEGVMDRIDVILFRIELLKHHLISNCQMRQTDGSPAENARTDIDAQILKLDEDAAFLRACNLGKEFMSDETVERLRALAELRWTDCFGKSYAILDGNELDCLLIRRGTLTESERSVIEDHVRHTIRMLSKIPFPNELKNVVRHAGGHHERMDGKGYPLKLDSSNLSLQARIIALADVFEALTAPDRPYRAPLKLSRAIDILADMSRSGHIDPDLFDLFIRQGVYKEYAREYLSSEQIDDVDEGKCLAASNF
ncbi:MAG: HD domain-containing phosphohydrolase [Rhodospirillales bacterium]